MNLEEMEEREERERGQVDHTLWLRCTVQLIPYLDGWASIPTWAEKTQEL